MKSNGTNAAAWFYSQSFHAEPEVETCARCGEQGTHAADCAERRFVDVISCPCGTCAIYATGTAPQSFQCANCGARIEDAHQDGAVRPMNLLAVSA